MTRPSHHRGFTLPPAPSHHFAWFMAGIAFVSALSAILAMGWH